MIRRLLVPLVLLAVPAAGPRADESAPGPETAMVVFEPRRRAVLSAEVASQALSVAREMGQSFQPGEVLVALDDRIYQANLTKARARLATARAQQAAREKLAAIDLLEVQIQRARALLAGARARLAAKEKLFADNTLSSAELETARTEARVAEADLELAVRQQATRKIETETELAAGRAQIETEEAGVKIAETELSACAVRAPFAGRASRVLTQPHEAVRPGQHLIEVVEDRVLLAVCLVPSRLLPKLALGHRVRILIQETEQPVEGQLSHIGAVVEPASSTVKVAVEIANTGDRLRAGMRGTLRLSDLLPPPGPGK